MSPWQEESQGEGETLGTSPAVRCWECVLSPGAPESSRCTEILVPASARQSIILAKRVLVSSHASLLVPGQQAEKQRGRAAYGHPGGLARGPQCPGEPDSPGEAVKGCVGLWLSIAEGSNSSGKFITTAY